MFLDELEALLRSRRDEAPAGSYTTSLLADPELLSRKVMEEAYELCLELGRPEPSGRRIAKEAADLLYHVLVGLVGADVALDEVIGVLEERRR